MDNANIFVDELLKHIDKKRLLIDNIMRLTLEQKKDIEENEANNIDQLVSQKQALIDSIDEIDNTFTKDFDLLKKQLKINSIESVDLSKYPLLKELKQKIEGIMAHTREIMIIEESNKEKLSLVMDEIKKEMKQLNVGKRSLRAYETPVTNNDGIYIDKKK